jgi:gliding motility-associated-like protein
MKNFSLSKVQTLSLILIFSVGIAIGSISRNTPSIESLLFSRNESLTADFTFSPNNVCSNEPINFTNTSIGTDLTYVWNFGDGSPVSTLKDPSHTFNATGGGTRVFTVSLTVTENGVPPLTIRKDVSIKEIPSLNVTSDKNSTQFENLKYFIVCENQPSQFTFYNAAGSTEKNILYQIDWGDGSPIFSGANWTELKHTYAVGIYNITYTVTPENGCKISRKYGVFIGSNPAVGLGNPGNTNVCVGDVLTFPITGTQNNPAGTIYTVTFSDGSAPQVFVHPAPASVSHTFTKTSCGFNLEPNFPNSFSVKIVAQNPCAASQASVVPIYVSEPPKAAIKLPTESVCVDQNITIENTTNFATEVSNNGTCSQEGKFIWEISPATGWTLQGGSTLGTRPNPTLPNTWISGSKNIIPRFTISGTYTIKLITGNRCGIKEEIKTICVIPRPLASFTLEKSEVCGPATVQATNTSNVLGTCGTSNVNTFTWSVSYSKGSCGTTSKWGFTGGTNKNSESPNFLFENPGIYTVRLTIAASCGSVFKEEKITVTAPPTVSINDIPNSCGPLTINPKATIGVCDSGAPVYKWTFEGGVPETSSNLDPGLVSFSTPGQKKISLEVISSCGSTKTEKVFTINELPVPDAGPDAEICSGEEIKLAGTTTGGVGPYSYEWTSTPASTFPGANTASPTVKPNQTTIYKLTVRDQTTNCISTDEVQIKVIPAPKIQFDIPDQEICSEETTKAINLTTIPVGELVTWTSEANGAGGVTPSGTNQIASQTLINTTGKPIDVVYTALIANSTQGNCTIVPAKYIIRVNPAPVYMNENRSICSDQELDFIPSNSLAGSKFTWTVSTPLGITGASNSIQPVSSIKQLLKNTTNTPIDVIYKVVPFLGACSGNSFDLKVTVQPAPSIIFSEPDQIICTGVTPKAVEFSSNVIGASFSWVVNPKGVTGLMDLSGIGNQIPSQPLINSTNQPITLEFQVTINSSTGNSCAVLSKTYRITVNPSIDLSDEVSDFNGFSTSCSGVNNGFIKLEPKGGNGIFTYSWTGPVGFSSNSKDIFNLQPGIYLVNVSDQFGCSVSKSYQIISPQPIVADVVSTKNILCKGDETGEIEISVLGGISSLPFKFEWKRNGNLIPNNSQNLSGVQAGTYEVKISDANGCFKILSDIKLTEPATELLINYQKTDIGCFGANDGSLALDVIGGQPPYIISWTFGSNLTSFDNLGPGDYTVTVADQGGCTRTEIITIEDAAVFESTPQVKQISCFGKKDGSIKLNLIGGVGKFTIRWDHGAELENLFNLSSGFYGVTIRDETSCEIRSEFNIVEPAQLQIEAKVTDALDCFNPQSGEIVIGIIGGTPPYSIQWSNGSTIEKLTGITSGQYAVTVKDASGCLINQNFDIKRPSPLNILSFRSTNIECNPRSIEEEFQITVTGGVAPYSIQWSGGKVSQDGKIMTTDSSGLYEVIVTDGKGCIKKESFEVNIPVVIPEAQIESTSFEQYNSLLVNFEIQFLNKSFGQITSYFWDFGDGSESFEENPKHTYSAQGEYEVTLKVKDIFGCFSEMKKKISVLDYYLFVPNVFTPNGDGVNDYYFPKFLYIESLEFWVLNKWGETIFYTDDLNSQGWNGKVNQIVGMPGNYVYKLKFKTLDGRTQTQTDLFLLLK